MYSVNDLFNFEKVVADYTGAPFVVATDGCNHGMELVIRFFTYNKLSTIRVPIFLSHWSKLFCNEFFNTFSTIFKSWTI